MEIDDELVAERELKEKCFHVWNALRKKAVFIRTFGALPRFAVPTPEYDRRWMESWVDDADVNDVRQRMLKYCPRRFWLQLNGDPKGECYWVSATRRFCAFATGSGCLTASLLTHSAQTLAGAWRGACEGANRSCTGSEMASGATAITLTRRVRFCGCGSGWPDVES